MTLLAAATAATLIALIKIPNEGGVFQRDYADYETCMEVVRDLQATFEDPPPRFQWVGRASRMPVISRGSPWLPIPS